MGHLWLNQRGEEESTYNDVEGEVYHYRSNVPGAKNLSEGDWFVYYRPGEYVLFGAGRVAEIEIIDERQRVKNSIAAKLQPKVAKTTTLTEYRAHIEEYHEFNPPISAREIKENISFLQGRKGLTGVPQASIYEISRDDYLTILGAADGTWHYWQANGT